MTCSRLVVNYTLVLCLFGVLQIGSHGFFPKPIGSGKYHEHLLYSFVSLHDLLINPHGVSLDLAYIYAHAVYKSDQINRYTYEEYMQIFNHSRLESKFIYPINDKKRIYRQDKCFKIYAKYPSMINSCDGIVLLFAKSQGSLNYCL